VPRLVLPLRANVCSLEYCPAAGHMLAVGSAGHQVSLCWFRDPVGRSRELKLAFVFLLLIQLRGCPTAGHMLGVGSAGHQVRHC
jgi:hypothetical protein